MCVGRPASFQKMVGAVWPSSSDLWGYVDNARRVTPSSPLALSTSPQVGSGPVGEQLGRLERP